MIECQCGYIANTKQGMAVHRHNCDVVSKLEVHKCNCGYFTNRKHSLLKHLSTCKKQYFNPNINYVFDLSDSTMEQMKKHQANMVELLELTITDGTYTPQFAQAKIMNEIKITTKYINNYETL